jgi:hypothetical protein
MDDLLQEAFRLKQVIDVHTSRLRDINKKIAESAVFGDGRSTTTILGQHIKAKIRLRDNVKWDQQRLEQVRSHFPDETMAVFVPKYEPRGKAALDGMCAQNEEFAKAVDWCRTVTPGAPSVTYELIESEVEDAA